MLLTNLHPNPNPNPNPNRNRNRNPNPNPKQGMLLIEPPPGLLDIVQPKRKERVTIRALIPARAQSLLDEVAAEPDSGGEAEGGAPPREGTPPPASPFTQPLDAGTP